jgi:hypothetical protein
MSWGTSRVESRHVCTCMYVCEWPSVYICMQQIFTCIENQKTFLYFPAAHTCQTIPVHTVHVESLWEKHVNRKKNPQSNVWLNHVCSTLSHPLLSPSSSSSTGVPSSVPTSVNKEKLRATQVQQHKACAMACLAKGRVLERHEII